MLFWFFYWFFLTSRSEHTHRLLPIAFSFNLTLWCDKIWQFRFCSFAICFTFFILEHPVWRHFFVWCDCRDQNLLRTAIFCSLQNNDIIFVLLFCWRAFRILNLEKCAIFLKDVLWVVWLLVDELRRIVDPFSRQDYLLTTTTLHGKILLLARALHVNILLLVVVFLKILAWRHLIGIWCQNLSCELLGRSRHCILTFVATFIFFRNFFI